MTTLEQKTKDNAYLEGYEDCITDILEAVLIVRNNKVDKLEGKK